MNEGGGKEGKVAVCKIGNEGREGFRKGGLWWE